MRSARPRQRRQRAAAVPTRGLSWGWRATTTRWVWGAAQRFSDVLLPSSCGMGGLATRPWPSNPAPSCPPVLRHVPADVGGAARPPADCHRPAEQDGRAHSAGAAAAARDGGALGWALRWGVSRTEAGAGMDAEHCPIAAWPAFSPTAAADAAMASQGTSAGTPPAGQPQRPTAHHPPLLLSGRPRAPPFWQTCSGSASRCSTHASRRRQRSGTLRRQTALPGA